ncbi:unnamed protein product [Cuscuta epithymum]|uniref:Uncharacterized protein n=1 Tax=Cuscuta epithymum TaxID=186058 RepID=A0AAV0FE44_9ASTE|nr:unnamed protein product [Cuscuta epithymum]
MMERQRSKKSGRKEEALTMIVSCNNNTTKGREFTLSPSSDENNNDFSLDIETGVFDFPWIKEGGASMRGYYGYNDNYDGDYEGRVEFDDLFSGHCMIDNDDISNNDATNSLPTISTTCDGLLEFKNDHDLWFAAHPHVHNHSSMRASTTYLRSGCSYKGELWPYLDDDKQNVDELDGTWTSLLAHPLENI